MFTCREWKEAAEMPLLSLPSKLQKYRINAIFELFISGKKTKHAYINIYIYEKRLKNVGGADPSLVGPS